MPVDPAPSPIRERLAAALRAQACDPHWVRLFRDPDAAVIAPPARAGVQWRADWVADPAALLAAAKRGGFGLALATDTALRAPVAELLIAALRARRPDILTAAFRDRVATALHEATVNACVHGNLGVAGGGAHDVDAFYAAVAAAADDATRAGKTITVAATLDDRALTVDVMDQGGGHTSCGDAVASDDAYTGRGLALIKVFADTLEFRDGGRHTRMTFTLPAEEAGR